jgi:hypothetical protein
MSHKLYTARQAAEAVLKKTHELLSKHDLMKGETGHEKGIHKDSVLIGSNDKGISTAGAAIRRGKAWEDKLKMPGAKKTADAHAKEDHKEVLGEIRSQSKPKLGKSEDELKKDATPPPPPPAPGPSGSPAAQAQASMRAAFGSGPAVAKSEESEPGSYGNVKPHLDHVGMASLPRATGKVNHMDLRTAHERHAGIAAAKGDHELANKHAKMGEMHRHYSQGLSGDHKKIHDAGKLHEELSKEEHLAKAESLHTELTKSEPIDKIKPKETAPSDKTAELKDPAKNPKEQAEGNNEAAGTTPTQVGQDGKNEPGFDEMKSALKLAKFIGHMHAKRQMKSATIPAEHKPTQQAVGPRAEQPQVTAQSKPTFSAKNNG